MTVEILDNIAKLYAIESRWQALVDACPWATPFQLSAWLLTWWKHFGGGYLQSYAFRDGDALCGLLPCFRHCWNGRIQLTLLGSGLSDYLDPVLPPAAIPVLADCLHEDRQWEVIDWQDLTAGSPLAQLPDYDLRPDTPGSSISLIGSFADFWRGRGKDLRRNLRRYSQRTRELGNVRFEMAAEARPGLTSELIRLHGMRWRRQGEPGMITLNHAEAFLRDIVSQLGKTGIARFFVMSLDSEILALILVFIYRKKIYSYMSAFDPEYEALGIGRMLMYESIQYAFANGYTHWDFLRGDEAYKFSWGAEPVSKIRVYKSR